MQKPPIATRRFRLAPSLARLAARERGSRHLSEGFFADKPDHLTHVDAQSGTAWLSLIGPQGEDRCSIPIQHAKVVLDVCNGRVVFARSDLNSAG